MDKYFFCIKTIHEIVGRCLDNTFVTNVGHKHNLLGYYCCVGENKMSLFSEQFCRAVRFGDGH